MTTPQSPQTSQIRLYLSQPHTCGYLSERVAASLFTDPLQTIGTAQYSRLVEHGFRRSGCNIYRPECPGCSACIAYRVIVNKFTPSRSFTRVSRQNEDLRVTARQPYASEEILNLYRLYLGTRHHGGGMDDPEDNAFLAFLACPSIDTRFYEFRDCSERLLAVAVVDHLDSALSAVYTFFDPNETRRSLGSYAILWQIAEAKRLGLPVVYLGYWIKESPKMGYKARFGPAEVYRNGIWRPLPPQERG